MNRLIACYSIWNEAKFLDTSIRSMWDSVDELMFVDGAFLGHADEAASNDGTLEIIDGWKNNGKPVTLIESGGFWLTQVMKRQEYVERVKEGDWVVIVDGDWIGAWLSGSKELIQSRGDVDGWRPVLLKIGDDGRIYRMIWGNPFIIRKAPGMHYCYNHYTILDGEGRNIAFPPYKVEATDLIQYYHRRHERGPERREAFVNWCRNCLEYANGLERFECLDCGLSDFKVPRGYRYRCPRCGSSLLGAFIENVAVG